jgi:oligopeptidase A
MHCATFRLAGVDLPPERKARYREVMQQLAQLATKFSENVLDAGRAYTRSVTDEAELAGLPVQCRRSRRRRCARSESTGWLFKLDQPTYMTVMTSAESEQLRRDIYEAWVTRASELGPSAGRFDNNPLIAELLPLRHELAQLLGFANYAEYALATRMAKSIKQVLGFLDDLARRCIPAGRQEFSDLEEFAGRKLNAWDLAYYSGTVAGKPLQSVAGGAAAVFPAAQGAGSGLFALTQRLYGISVRERPGVTVWHPSVRYYDLLDAKRWAGGRLLPRSVFAHRKAQRRLDGRVRGRQVPALGNRPSRGAAGMQLHGSRGQPRRRC